MLYVGRTARELRHSLGLTQRAAAEELDVSCVHLCNIENNKSMPSAALLKRYRDLWGVDLYVLAWCRHGDVSKLPKPIREAAIRLERAWSDQVDRIMDAPKDEAGRQCSGYKS